jgi:hypothetical protein
MPRPPDWYSRPRESIKHLCTESEEGREIEHHPDSWLESEIARFHRGISLALLFLAGLLLVVEMI